jgi:hypothetical protein
MYLLVQKLGAHRASPFEANIRGMPMSSQPQAAPFVYSSEPFAAKRYATMSWSDFPAIAHDAFRTFRSPAGEDAVLGHNVFIEKLLLGGSRRSLSEAEKAEYRRPFLNPGEERRPTLSWPRQMPLEDEPADVVKVVAGYGEWLATSEVPKLYLQSNPGALDAGQRRSRQLVLSRPR